MAWLSDGDAAGVRTSERRASLTATLTRRGLEFVSSSEVVVMRRATGREGKLCAETPDNKTGANEQTVITIHREMRVEQIGSDRGHSGVFINFW